MLAELLGRTPKTDGADPRAELRQRQTDAKRAATTAQAAEQAVARAEAVIARARDALSACGDIDGTIAQHRAAEVRSGGTGSGPLPPALATYRQRQQRAGEDLADAVRTADILACDARQAQERADAAKAMLLAAVEVVARAEFDREAAELRRVEQAVAVRRLELAAMVDGAELTAAHWPAVAMLRDPWHSMLIQVAPNGVADLGKWAAFRQALMSDAGAEFVGG